MTQFTNPIAAQVPDRQSAEFVKPENVVTAMTRAGQLEGLNLSTPEQLSLRALATLKLPDNLEYSVYCVSPDSREFVLRTRDENGRLNFLSINAITCETRNWTPAEMLTRLRDFSLSSGSERILGRDMVEMLWNQKSPDEAFFADPRTKSAMVTLERTEELHALFNKRIFISRDLLYSFDKTDVKVRVAELYGGIGSLISSGSLTPETLRWYLERSGAEKSLVDTVMQKTLANACDNLVTPFERSFDPRTDRFSESTLGFRIGSKGTSPEFRAALIDRLTSRGFRYREPGSDSVVGYSFERVGDQVDVRSEGRAPQEPKGVAAGERERGEALLRTHATLSAEDFRRLFPPDNVFQTDVGNCYMVALFRGLGECRSKEPGAPSPMEVLARTSIEALPHGYYVSLPLGSPDGQRYYVSKSDLRGDERAFGARGLSGVVGGEGWKVLEHAYLMRRAGGRFDRQALDGQYSLNEELKIIGPQSLQTASFTRNDPESGNYLLDLFARGSIVLEAITPPSPAGGNRTFEIRGRPDIGPLFFSHAYAVTRVEGEKVTLCNTHLDSKPFTITRDQLREYFSRVSGTELLINRAFRSR